MHLEQCTSKKSFSRDSNNQMSKPFTNWTCQGFPTFSCKGCIQPSSAPQEAFEYQEVISKEQLPEPIVFLFSVLYSYLLEFVHNWENLVFRMNKRIHDLGFPVFVHAFQLDKLQFKWVKVSEWNSTLQTFLKIPEIT